MERSQDLSIVNSDSASEIYQQFILDSPLTPDTFLNQFLNPDLSTTDPDRAKYELWRGTIQMSLKIKMADDEDEFYGCVDLKKNQPTLLWEIYVLIIISENKQEVPLFRIHIIHIFIIHIVIFSLFFQCVTGFLKK